MAKKKKKKYSEKPKPPVTTQQTEEITKNPDNTETSNDGAVSQNQQEADTPDTAPVLENETVSSAEQPSAQDTVADKETAQADTNDNDDDNNKDIDTLVQSDTVETTDEKPSPKHTKKKTMPVILSSIPSIVLCLMPLSTQNQESPFIRSATDSASAR